MVDNFINLTGAAQIIGKLKDLLSAIEAEITGKLDKAGGTMTGVLTLSGSPTANLHAATKKYVDDAVGGISGGGGFYGVCDSSGTNRSVTIDGFELKTGVAIDVKFTVDSGYKNYLNVNLTGNKLIYTDTYNYTQKQTWVSGQIVRFVYDGSSWNMVGSGNYVTAGLIDESVILGARATAEGHNSTSTGNYSHAEGDENTASGTASHSEGVSTTASGYASHSEGVGTTAQRKSQHVFGEFNELDTSGASESVRGQYVEIVGNGSSLSLSNARTLDWDGNEVLAGKLTVGAAPTNDMDAATKKYVDGSVPSEATEDTYGLVKLNPSESVTLNSDGQLVVGGRLGQYPNGGGVYYPTSIEPTNVGGSSFLMTDGAKGVSVSQRTFAILGGANITCKSAAAGSTQYRVSNTYANRFACCAVKGGRAALNQTDAAANGTAAITSIKYANGNDVTVHFGPNEPDNDIIITLSKTINPSSSTTTIRCYGTNSTTDNILVGQGVGAMGGKVISLGQSTFAGGNQTVAIGNSVHVTNNNSVGLGHTMLVNKQYSFGVGQGHDFTNGTGGTTAVGTWSNISSNTRFAVGNGNGYLSRSNIFEVTDDSGQTGLILKSPNGSRFKIKVDNNGNLTASAV